MPGGADLEKVLALLAETRLGKLRYARDEEEDEEESSRAESPVPPSARGHASFAATPPPSPGPRSARPQGSSPRSPKETAASFEESYREWKVKMTAALDRQEHRRHQWRVAKFQEMDVKRAVFVRERMKDYTPGLSSPWENVSVSSDPAAADVSLAQEATELDRSKAASLANDALGLDYSLRSQPAEEAPATELTPDSSFALSSRPLSFETLPDTPADLSTVSSPPSEASFVFQRPAASPAPANYALTATSPPSQPASPPHASFLASLKPTAAQETPKAVQSDQATPPVSFSFHPSQTASTAPISSPQRPKESPQPAASSVAKSQPTSPKEPTSPKAAAKGPKSKDGRSVGLAEQERLIAALNEAAAAEERLKKQERNFMAGLRFVVSQAFNQIQWNTWEDRSDLLVDLLMGQPVPGLSGRAFRLQRDQPDHVHYALLQMAEKLLGKLKSYTGEDKGGMVWYMAGVGARLASAEPAFEGVLGGALVAVFPQVLPVYRPLAAAAEGGTAEELAAELAAMETVAELWAVWSLLLERHDVLWASLAGLCRLPPQALQTPPLLLALLRHAKPFLRAAPPRGYGRQFARLLALIRDSVVPGLEGLGGAQTAVLHRLKDAIADERGPSRDSPEHRAKEAVCAYFQL